MNKCLFSVLDNFKKKKKNPKSKIFKIDEMLNYINTNLDICVITLKHIIDPT